MLLGGAACALDQVAAGERVDHDCAGAQARALLHGEAE